MPTDRSAERDHPTTRRRLTALAVVCLLSLLGACTGGGDGPGPVAERDLGRAASAQTSPERAVLGPRIATLLDRRAAAVRAGDPTAFERSVGGDRVAQQQWFGNLAQLPVGALSLELDPASLVRDGDTHWGTVAVALRLEGYDERAVVTHDRYQFARVGGRLRVTSVTDPAWERRNPGDPQPWDLGPVTVVEGAGVLGVFDAGSAARAADIMAAVEGGVASIAPRIPLGWDRRVVVYALSSPQFLDGLAGVPGGDPLAVDGLTFPVMTGVAPVRVAATRFVLNPRLLDADPASRDRLVRHELVHVALGSRDDEIPVWLSEGLAEYLSVQALAPAERVVSGEALEAARRGVTALPDDETFNGPESLANYGISWWVCEAIAQTWGEQMLWTLVRELDASADPEARLTELLGVPPERLVRDASRLMLDTYRPGA